jgi:hypothetical protein
MGFVLAPAVRADVLQLGLLSFDNLIPDVPGLPGLNAFDLANDTGLVTATAATFTNASLTLSNGDVILLGDIGALTSLPAVQFLTTDTFTSAEFKATLDVSSFLLSDGTTFTADSTAIDVLLLPSVGNSLVAGTDAAFITVSNTPSPVPEPETWLMGAPLFWLLRKTRKSAHVI